jgi:hypothetical protein
MRHLVICLLAATSTLYAQESQPSTHVKEAMKKFQDHDYAGASVEFKAAYAIEARPEILFAWAQAVRLGGDCPTAVKLYKEYLASNPDVRQRAAAEWSINRCGEDQPTSSPTVEEPAASLPANLEHIDTPPPPPPPYVPPPPSSPSEGAPVAAITLGGVGVASLGAALACYLVSSAKEDALKHATSYPDYLADGKSADNFRIGAIGGAALGGGLIVAGVIDLLVRRHHHVHAVPASGGVALGGSF